MFKVCKETKNLESDLIYAYLQTSVFGFKKPVEDQLWLAFIFDLVKKNYRYYFRKMQKFIETFLYSKDWTTSLVLLISNCFVVCFFVVVGT